MTEQGTPRPGSPEPVPPAEEPVADATQPMSPPVEPAAAPMLAPAAPPPQPTVAWQPPAPPPAVPPTARSGLAMGAGITLLILGILGLLIAAFAIAGGAFFAQLAEGVGEIPGLPTGVSTGEVVAAGFAFVGVIVGAFSLAYIIGGIGVLRSRDWGRVTGIVVAVISGLFWLMGLSGGGDRGGLVFVVIMLALHAYVFYALVFRWRAT